MNKSVTNNIIRTGNKAAGQTVKASGTAKAGNKAAGRTKLKLASGSGRQRKGRTASGAKVWAIFHFLQRYEMDEYRRQGGLDYIRMTVTATTIGKSNETSEFIQQLAELRHFYPEQYYHNVGIFWALVSLTATKEDWLRGYLVDGDLLPLTEGKIAARLFIGNKQTGQALNALKRVGLIEYIPCPQFKQPLKEKSRSEDKKHNIRKHSQTFPNVSKPLNNKNEIKRKINKEKKKTELKSNPKETKTEAGQTQQQKQNTTDTEPTDSTSTQTQTIESVEPESSNDSDVGAVVTHHVPTQPHTVHRSGKAEAIGNIISGVFPAHWQDPDAEEFGWQIVEAIGYSTDRQDKHSRSEWGAFAAWWSRVKAVARPALLGDIRAAAIKQAAFLNSPKARSSRNKSAVWFKIMAGELVAQGITLPDCRASPA